MSDKTLSAWNTVQTDRFLVGARSMKRLLIATVVAALANIASLAPQLAGAAEAD